MNFGNAGFELGELVRGFASAIVDADAKRPIAKSARSNRKFQAGIGPCAEPLAVSLIMRELAVLCPEKYEKYQTSVNYPGSKQECDLCFGLAPDWDWAVEVKLFRLCGDNGKPNDHMLTHLLSPYPGHRSALTDLEKLRGWKGPKKKAIIIYAFNHNRWPIQSGIDAFEVLARSRATLSKRFEAPFSGLVHPVHSAGAVVGWQLLHELEPSPIPDKPKL